MNQDKHRDYEGWVVPIEERSLIKKVNSTRAVIGDGFKVDDYQAALRDKAISYAKNKKSVIDVGAHIGIWSVAFSKVFSQVHAFEINPDVLSCLELNIQNRNIKNVIIHSVGLGDKDELVELTPTKSKSMGVSVIPNSVGSIPVKTLDSFNLSVDLLKMDVEGFELQVLIGGKETILKNKPIIVMEEKDLYKKYDGILPSQFLEQLGMITLNRYKKDVIYGWKE
jgi:FkbM family methyltransferase